MARKILKIGLFSVAGLFLLGVILQALGLGQFRLTLPVEHESEYVPAPNISYPPALQVEGNRLVDGRGEAIRLRGVMIPDPYRLEGENRFNPELIAEIRATGANVIRIPVHPENWQHDPDYLWRYLDPLVSWAGEAGLYAIIDWHYVGNIATGVGDQMPDLETPPQELTDEFWQITAGYFRKAPHVIFEAFNEPESISAEAWRLSAGEIVRLIRGQGAGQVIIVGGIDFGRDLSWVLQNPIEAGNIAYASHIYPAHSRSRWDDWFGEVAEKHPVLITEWGFMDENRKDGPPYLAGNEESYGRPFLDYLEERQMSWVACWYDDQWLPAMFTGDGKAATRYGEFILRELSEAKNPEG